jgi:hypothetical protein
MKNNTRQRLMNLYGRALVQLSEAQGAGRRRGADPLTPRAQHFQGKAQRILSIVSNL